MSIWIPKGFGGLVGGNTPLQPTQQMPKPELPEIGDTVLIAAFPYQHQIIGEGTNVPNGTDVIEVGVKAIKKAKLTLE